MSGAHSRDEREPGRKVSRADRIELIVFLLLVVGTIVVALVAQL